MHSNRSIHIEEQRRADDAMLPTWKRRGWILALFGIALAFFVAPFVNRYSPHLVATLFIVGAGFFGAGFACLLSCVAVCSPAKRWRMTAGGGLIVAAAAAVMIAVLR